MPYQRDPKVLQAPLPSMAPPLRALHISECKVPCLPVAAILCLPVAAILLACSRGGTVTAVTAVISESQRGLVKSTRSDLEVPARWPGGSDCQPEPVASHSGHQDSEPLIENTLSVDVA